MKFNLFLKSNIPVEKGIFHPRGLRKKLIRSKLIFLDITLFKITLKISGTRFLNKSQYLFT